MFERQTTGSVVCPNCGALVGVNDDRCYRCGQSNPGMWGFAPLLRRLGNDFGFLQIVLTTCVALYAITLLSDPSSIRSGGLFSLLSPGQRPLFLFGASGALPVFGYGRWWTVLSAAWLHGGLIHIGFNMLWLRDIVPAVNAMYGAGRLIIIYTVSSAAGFAATSIMGLFPLGMFSGAAFTIGASAPMFGLFGALIVYSRASGDTHIGQTVWRWVIIFGVIGLIIPMVDNWAHIGGFAGGYLTALVLDPRKEQTPRELLIAGFCLLANALSIVASVLTGLKYFT